MLADLDSTLPQPTPKMLTRLNLLSSSVLIAETVLRFGLVAVVSFWIARVFGPAQFGVLNYASALVMVFWTAALLGLDTPLVNKLTREAKPGSILGSAMALRAIAGLLGALASLLAVVLMRGDERLPLLLTAVVALSIPLSAPYVLDSWFKFRHQALQPALARLIGTGLGLLAKVAVLTLGLDVVALAWTITLETALTSLGLWWSYRAQRIPREQKVLSVSRAQAQELARSCWPFLVSSTVMAIYMKVDVLLMGMLADPTQTGIFSLSQKLTEVTFLIPVVVVEALYPQLVRTLDSRKGGVQGSMQTFFDFILAVAFVSALVAFVAVEFCLIPLFGAAYDTTVLVFQFHVWAAIGMALAHARYKWMGAVGLESLTPLVTGLGLVFAVVLHITLIPRFGAVGAALATSIAYIASGLALSFAFKELRPAGAMQLRALWPWGRLWREARSMLR